MKHAQYMVTCGSVILVSKNTSTGVGHICVFTQRINLMFPSIQGRELPQFQCKKEFPV